MGLNQPRIYLDSCIVIYVVEKHPIYAARIEALMQQTVASVFCYSALVRLECLIKPFRTNDAGLRRLYEVFLGAQQMLDLTVTVFDAAAQLRASQQGLKTPDAIHLAAALNHKCTEFWTNDDRLNSCAPNLAKNVI